MDPELVDSNCRVERRLAELTYTAYERDVRACMRSPIEKAPFPGLFP